MRQNEGVDPEAAWERITGSLGVRSSPAKYTSANLLLQPTLTRPFDERSLEGLVTDPTQWLSLHAPVCLKDGKWIVLRVPYPLGFYTKLLDGRIDDPNGGWKGRGLWSTVSTRSPFHMETGKGTTSKVVRFQLRPDPLAK
jgi:hypothetical protein